MFIPLYIDNSLCAHNHPTFFQHIISKLEKHLEMSYLGPAHFMLGIEIIQDWNKGTITLSQQQYVLDMLEKYGMSNCHTCPTPMTPKMELTTAQSPQTHAKCMEAKTIPYQNVTGSLLYATMATQPNIAFAVGVLCHFNSNHGQTHWTAAKWVMPYLKGRRFHGCRLGDVETWKSTSGYIFTFPGGPISWSSKAQVTLALSSTEAKYVSTTQAAQEAIYLCTFLSELNLPPSSPSFYVTTKVPYPSQNPLLLTPDSNILTSDTTSYDQPSQMVTLKWNGSPPWTKWPTSWLSPYPKWL